MRETISAARQTGYGAIEDTDAKAHRNPVISNQVVITVINGDAPQAVSASSGAVLMSRSVSPPIGNDSGGSGLIPGTANGAGSRSRLKNRCGHYYLVGINPLGHSPLI